MSEADKLFEELGYTKKELNCIPELKLDSEEEAIFEHKCGFVIFYKSKEIAMFSKEIGFLFSADMKDLQAINKKVEEFGWIKNDNGSI